MKEVIETIADSIAIEILNEHNIITGKGNQLYQYTKKSTEENAAVQEIRVNEQLTNKIHGICKGEEFSKGVLLVYGEKEFILVQYQTDDDIPHRLSFKPAFYRATLKDWISCGILTADANQLILCTAHSIILRFNYSAKEGSCLLSQRISCSDKSTLYCAYLFGSTWSDLVVFAGNAFGELLIWQPSQVDDVSKSVTLIHRISAHNGVIFSIDYDKESQQLITTSDDRAVKWWRVKFLNDCLECWKTTSLQAVASGYGHVARVFRGRIIKDGSQIYALSAGEDSYICLWRNNGELVYKRRQQYGATIWNFSYHSNSKTIYTVGSVGNIIAFGFKSILQDAAINSTSLLQLLPVVSAENPKEYVAKVKLISNENNRIIVGITNENRLIWLKMINATKKDIRFDEEWSVSDVLIDFKCTVMEVNAYRLALCGYKKMILLDWNIKNQLFEIVINMEILQSVIRTFVFFTNDKYLFCDDGGNCHLVSPMWSQRSVQLPKCKEPWLTTALLLKEDNVLIVSNRLGNLLFYVVSENGNQYELRKTIKHPHGNLGATNMQLLEEKEIGAYIRSTGHDGATNIFFVNYNVLDIKFCSRLIIPVSWVEHIERGECNKTDLYLGFNDNHFVIWSKEYDFLQQLSCGGGHRCWHFALNYELNEISLVFVKNKRIRFYILPLFNKQQLAMPPAKRWHIAACNNMVIFDKTIAISAADDNLIKIHEITESGLVPKLELHQHISNVRALRTIKDSTNELSFLIFSGGGRAQLCITQIRSNDFYSQELINYTLGKTEYAEANNNTSQNNKNYKFDPETRIMSLDVKNAEENVYHIIVGCSDGFLRLLKFDILKNEVKQFKQYFYNRCILQVEYIRQGQLILTAATDGKLRIFDSGLKECLHELKHHSSGINGLSTFYNEKENSLKILTGGDDQAVSYTVLCLDTYQELDSFHKPFLHTAQVCAAVISSDGKYGYTSGVDQNVYKLDLTTVKRDNDEDSNVLDTFHSCVADIKGIALAKGNMCLIYGCGLQIITD